MFFKKLFHPLFLIAFLGSASAQIQISTTSNYSDFGNVSTSSDAMISFVIENNSVDTLVFEDITMFFSSFSANNTTLLLWVSDTDLSGTSTVNAQNYSNIAFSGPLAVPSNGEHLAFSNINHIIYPNSIQRFVVQSTNGFLYRMASGTLPPSSYSTLGVFLHVGDYQISGQPVGRYGLSPTINTTAFFMGSVSLSSFSSCSGVPNVGAAQSNSPTVCLGDTLFLSVDSVELKQGVQYQWQESFDGLVWNDMSGDTMPSISTVATDTANFRLKVSCGSDTAYSDPVSITVYSNPLSGNYTINQSQPTAGTNFTSFSDFSHALSCGGVSGAVVVNVDANSGPYNEAVSFGEIPGASATNTVTINGNGNTLQYSGTSEFDRVTLFMRGTKHLEIDSLTVRANHNTQGIAVMINSGSEHIAVRNCSIIAAKTTSTLSSIVLGCIAINNTDPPGSTLYGPNASHVTIENNYIEGGIYGVSIYGLGVNFPLSGSKIANNTITDQRSFGIQCGAQQGIEIIGNDISRPTLNILSYHTFTGIYFNGSCPNSVIKNNRIHNTNDNIPLNGNSFIKGIHLDGVTAGMTASTPLVVGNNLIYALDKTGNRELISVTNCNHIKLFHNTLVMDDPLYSGAGFTRMFNFNIGSNLSVECKNNIAYFNRVGTGEHVFLHNGNSQHNVDSDRNAFFTPNINLTNVNIARENGINYSTIINWQQSGSFDQNSIFENPMFIGGTVDDFLRPQAGALKAVGFNANAFVPEDIEGVSRPSNPDIGAYQFDGMPGVDMTIVRFTKPLDVCGDSLSVAVEVNNQAADTVQTIWINWSINGVPQPTVVVSDTFFQGNIIEIPLGGFLQDSTPSYDIQASIDSVYPGVDIDLTNNSASLLNFRTKLSGTYTLDKNASQTRTNFTSFNEFADALNDYGICGPVLLDVVPQSGPYSEFVEFNAVNGVSPTDTILIKGNGNIIQYDPVVLAFRRLITFDGASYISIDSLEFHPEGPSGGCGIYFTGGSSHLNIINCSIITPLTASSSNITGIEAGGIPSSNKLNHTTIQNNYIEGGNDGIIISGGTSFFNFGVENKVINNTLVDQANHGISVDRQVSLWILGNDISRPNQSTNVDYYGISVNFGMPNARVENNRVYNTSNSMQGLSPTVYALDFRSVVMEMANNPMVVANNQVYNIKGEGDMYGIYSNSNSNVRFYHNTIVLGESNMTSTNRAIGMYHNGPCTNCQTKNNIFYIDHTATINNYLFFLNSQTNMAIDYNVYFSPNLSHPNMHLGFYINNIFSDLSAWQQVNNNAYDQNSFFLNPTFIGGSGDDSLRPSAAAISQMGENLQAFVPVDFEGTLRTTTPDPGVYEYVPDSCAGIFNFEIDTINPGSAVLSWESFTSEWQVAWDSCGIAPGLATSVMDSSVTINQGYELSGLPQGKCVCVFVREVCDSNTTSVWVGPFEICIPTENDLELKALTAPIQYDCGEDSAQVSVRVYNHGTQDATGFDVVVEMSGDITGLLTTNFTAVVASESDVLIDVGNVDLSDGGNVEFTAYIDWVADSNSTNDTLRKTLHIQRTIPLQIYSSVDTICGTDPVMFYTDSMESSPYLHWYDGDSNLIGTGDSILVSQFDSTFTIRLQADSMDGFGTIFAGPLDATILGSAGNFGGLGAQSLLVEAYTQVTLLSATVHPSGPGTIHVEIREVPGRNVIYDFPVYVSPTLPGDPVSIALNVVLPPGEYELGANSALSNVGLLRNGNGASYPYGDPNIFEITGSTFSASTYYFYYNIEVQYGSCPRSAVNTKTLPIGEFPNADFTYNINMLNVDFYNTSAAGDSVSWDFSGLGTDMGDTVSFQFPQADSFEVCMTAWTKCFDETVCKKIYVTDISVVAHPLENSLRVYPNPNNGKFALEFDLKVASDVSIELLDMRGRILWFQSLQNHTGQYRESFDQSSFSSGSYMLRIHTRDGLISKKVVIQQ
ncbi:MAG: T9SS type A sorting domain-containing protein [Cryomorphaceae bacterium]|nr:T9SS type A sorting domain-containing protein [Cryomorphaceae bacterium]